jgi:hypothetical protein
MIKQTRYFTVAFAALLPVLILSTAQSGCGKGNDDDTKTTASVPPPPPPPPPPTAPAIVAPEEDAGIDAGSDADASDGKVVVGTGGGAAASIAKCCAALQQNANSAPIEQKGAYQAAAAACQGLRNTPVAQQAFSQIRSFLLGAKMPGACQ